MQPISVPRRQFARTCALEPARALALQGVKNVKEPKKSPGGTCAVAFVEDPNGIPVELLEPREGRVS